MNDFEITATSAEREKRVQKAQEKFSGSLGSWVVKIILLGLVDAVLVAGALTAITTGSWLIFAVIVVLLIAINVIYLPPNRLLPGKYLAPGVIFMLIFSVSVMFYTIYIAFTNYGDGHNGPKSDAVVAIIKNNQTRVEDSPVYPSGVADKDGDLWLLVIDPETDQAMAGSNDQQLQPIEGVELTSIGAIKSAEGFDMLPFAEISRRSAEVAALQVPISEDPEDGYLRTTTGSEAYLYQSTMHYDEAADTMTDVSGKVYHDNGRGAFVADDGTQIMPGWRVWVGTENFQRAFQNDDIRVPFLRVLAWTFVFSILSVLTTFALGLFLAVVFNEKRMGGRRIYRIIMILPYAFPATMMTMVWGGLFNQDFGFINQVLLGGADINWLNSSIGAKIAVLIVNLWLGFPYQFLVCTGALQSLPDDVMEAANVDGASPWQTFVSIKLPLLMVSLAPLLISSFAFNFNNFNLIFMLTRGGPRFIDTSLNAGSTDILISMVYKVAFDAGSRDYGLGSAFAILIFIIVGITAAIGFRQTKALEDIN